MVSVLSSLRVVEFAGLGPAPFAAMMLADAGADVVRVTRPGDPAFGGGVLERGRVTVEADLKDPESCAEAALLIRSADVLIEGYRPGVMERLGLGPTEAMRDNPALVYARMSGWGQDGPFAARPGHDINYLAMSGALFSIARRGEAPMPPLNLVADFGGGGMLLAFGVLAAVIDTRQGGPGRVIDASMLEGTNLLMAGVWNRVAAGRWSREPGTNDLDLGAPYYNVYATADGRHVAMGAVEPQFYRAALERLGLPADEFVLRQHERSDWERAKAEIAEAFALRDLAHWSDTFEDVDACVTPVLNLDEARSWAHARHRGMFALVDQHVHPAPAPRFDAERGTPSGARQGTVAQVLERWQRAS